jgi:hypothetical protein
LRPELRRLRSAFSALGVDSILSNKILEDTRTEVKGQMGADLDFICLLVKPFLDNLEAGDEFINL